MKPQINEWHIWIDAVLHTLFEYDFRKKKKNVECVLIVGNTRTKTEKSKNEAIFGDYEQEEIVLRPDAYDIRN